MSSHRHKIPKFIFSWFVAICIVGVLLSSYSAPDVEAYDTSCPPEMSNEECLEYLQEQAEQIGNERNELGDSIDAENAEQMTLWEQINYINSLISDTELKIDELELDIEKNTVEIRILEDEILELQGHIDTLQQEFTTLETRISERMRENYKMSFSSPLEVVLSSTNLETTLQKMKYLMVSKERDDELMAEMSDARDELEAQEAELDAKLSDVIAKKNQIEADREEMAQKKKDLASQRAQQASLMAESEAREAAYMAELNTLQAIQNEVDAQVAAIIMEMYRSGQLGNGTPVSPGQIVGFQGHTGCSFGSHLHFSVNSGTPYSGWGYFWGDVNPYGYMGGGKPMSGYVVTQGYHQGMAIDLVSTTDGNQLHEIYGSCWVNPTENQCYYVSQGELACSPGTSGWFSLRGENAYVRTVAGGKVYYGTESWYGGKFAMVIHDNGYVSIYLHIK